MTYADVRPPEPPSGGEILNDSFRPGAVETLFPNVEIPASASSGAEVPVRQRPGKDGPCEEHTARVRTTPTKPSSAEVASHEATHTPYRSWCKVCVAASAREDPHPRRKQRDEETGLPMISMDYELLEEKVTVLVAKDESSGATLAYECETKGPGDDWVIRQLDRDLQDWGRKDICVQSDGEPAIIAVQQALAEARSGTTMLRNSPAYTPQANGGAEKAVQDVTDIMRRLILGLEAKLKCRVDVSLPIVKWIVRHAAFVLTRFQVGHDGLTPWRRLTGKSWNGQMFHFGESVMGRLSFKKPGNKKKASRGKKKLAARSLPGIWLGVYPRTGEHIVALESGEAIRVRTVHRLSAEDQWNADAVLAVRALPRKPSPNDTAGEPRPRRNTEADDGAGDRVDGANLGETDHDDQAAEPRELRLTTRLLTKYGYTDGCPGCENKERGAPYSRGHSTLCRQRIYDRMKNDEDELERLIKVDSRLRRTPPVDEQIRRPTAGQPTAAMLSERASPAGDRREVPEDPVAAPKAEELAADPTNVEMNDPEGPDEDQSDDDIRDVPDADLVEEENDTESEDEQRRPEKKQRDAESDREGKRQRTAMLSSRAQGAWPCSESASLSECRSAAPPGPNAGDIVNTSALDELQSLLRTATVRKIIEELNEKQKFQMPRNRKDRKNLLQETWDTECGEVYSPPRVIQIVSELGLRPAWSLDLTTIDAEDGNSWDCSDPAKRR